MFIFYNIFFLIILIISPIIIIVRIFLGKEDRTRFKEKFCFFSKRNKINGIIWIHGASVGEIFSIIPIVKKFEKDKKIKKILVTSTTKSSSYILSKYKFKKTVHQFYPLDLNILTKIFIDHWKPKIAIFVDSEIWPNMFNNLHKKNIPIILINARITKKSFNRWRFFPKFSKKLFEKITIALPQNMETKKYLKLLGVKNIKNLLTVIIPRHINRRKEIADGLLSIGLNSELHTECKKLRKNTEVYIVDTYGEAPKFYSLSRLTFVGGSLIPHGGQNPLEPAREGNYILFGPNTTNFKEVYQMLEKLKIASKIKSISNMKNVFLKKINYSRNSRVSKKLNSLGNKIINKNMLEIKKLI